MATEQKVRHETGIQWTHVPGYIGATWNPTTGCTRVSPGCDNCYAFTLHDQRYKSNLDAAREHPPISIRDLSHGPDLIGAKRREDTAGLPLPKQYDVPFSTVQMLDGDRLTEPLRKQKPHAYFVDSMADLFHEDVTDAYLDRVFAVMALAPRHLFMVLTKRPKRMRAYLTHPYVLDRIVQQYDAIWAARSGERPYFAPSLSGWPLPNVWLGVSAEDQERADERIPLLLQTPAAVRFVSYEPALGPVEFSRIRLGVMPGQLGTFAQEIDAVHGLHRDGMGMERRLKHRLDWIIVGGESGPRARPFNIGWAREAIIQGEQGEIAVFVKQLGARPVFTARGMAAGDPVFDLELQHSHGSEMSQWPEDLRVRQFPAGHGDWRAP